MSCSTSTSVRSSLSVPRKRIMRCVSSSPIPARGSAGRRRRGFGASAIAISSWRCSPWARLAASTSARSPSPTEARTARAGSRSARSARAGRQKAKLCPECAWTASATLSSAEKSRKRLVIWKERARPRRDRAGASRPAMSRPAKLIVPASTLRSPASCERSVVLPAPFGPMIAWVSPLTTSRSTRSVARSPPKLLLSPRTARNSSAIAGRLAGQEAEEPAFREEHDQDEEGPEDDLPVLGQSGQHVPEEQEHDRAHDRPVKRPHPPEDHHEHDLARAGPVHEVGRQVLGLVREERARQAAHAPGEHERRELVAVGGKADRPGARLVRPGAAHDPPEAPRDPPPPQDEEEEQGPEDQGVERGRGPQVDEGP